MRGAVPIFMKVSCRLRTRRASFAYITQYIKNSKKGNIRHHSIGVPVVPGTYRMYGILPTVHCNDNKGFPSIKLGNTTRILFKIIIYQLF